MPRRAYITDLEPTPPLPKLRLTIGVTGHRAGHASYPADEAGLHDAVEHVFASIDRLAQKCGAQAPVRLHTLLADGTDQFAADKSLARGWELSVPLPFGRRLNRAIAAQPTHSGTAKRILRGEPVEDGKLKTRLDALKSFEDQAALFEMAERDAVIERLFISHLEDPANDATTNEYIFETAQRYALAARVIIEQSDLVIAVWDGHMIANTGGTGDTVRRALAHAVPVLRIDPANPDGWSIITATETLAHGAHHTMPQDREVQLEAIVSNALGSADAEALRSLNEEHWHTESSIAYHAYRRVEALFGETGFARRFKSIRQRYETPQAIATGSGLPLLEFVQRIVPDGSTLSERFASTVLARLAWADGIATDLSDRYRSGMIINFLLGSIAIIAGVLYLPLGGADYKWIFAGIELATLLVIVINTYLSGKRNLHTRWLAARRAAEYLRQRPLMLVSGVARPAGQWPRGEKSGWPELYARQTVREIGLPEAVVDESYLRATLTALNELQVKPQRDYHQAKSIRLDRVHHALDLVSEGLFAAAIVAVTTYLVMAGLSSIDMLPMFDLHKVGKWLTVLGVAFPTMGGALAGIRYFGDFERFAGISQVTALHLDEIAGRIAELEQAPTGAIGFANVADLLRATDAVVFAELESWQAIFNGKRVAVPV